MQQAFILTHLEFHLARATSVMAFLVCANIYFRQVTEDIRTAALSAPAPRLTILPVTLTAAAVHFVIIWRSSPDPGRGWPVPLSAR